MISICIFLFTNDTLSIVSYVYGPFIFCEMHNFKDFTVKKELLFWSRTRNSNVDVDRTWPERNQKIQQQNLGI